MIEACYTCCLIVTSGSVFIIHSYPATSYILLAVSQHLGFAGILAI